MIGVETAIPWIASTFFLAGVLVGIGAVLAYLRTIDAEDER